MNPLVTEARALCRDATDGPWHAGRGDMGTFVDGYESKWIYAGEPAEKSKYLAVSSGYEIKKWGEVMANARLIARSRTLLPEMAAEIERLEGELDKANDLISRAGVWLDAYGKDGMSDVMRAISEHLGPQEGANQ